jgi:magnesium chelatase family protein
LGHPQKPCRDTPSQIQKYRSRISGPLLDRIDMHVEVPTIPFKDLSAKEDGESSAIVRHRVSAARVLQQTRLGPSRTNALMTPRELTHFCSLDPSSEHLLHQAVEKMGISARGYGRILKVARTIADLDEKATISKEHLMEAIGYRSWESAVI